MAKWIAWYGYGVRELHGFRWENGQAHLVEDEEVALDILTQPGEDFREVDPPAPQEVSEPAIKLKRGRAVADDRPAEETQ
ncbi:MAG: hypothetical protein KJ077_08150 [Anaerolineae bacterium]|nr:hypothetical protein [Anaerolineae bacterium]